MGRSARRNPKVLARRLLGFEDLRPGQEESMRAVLEGRDVLAVLPTGAGKSAIYQVAAAVMPGPTVVVSPLIALQKDQVDKLERPDVGDAALVNSTIAAGRQREAFSDLEQEALEFMFLAPEQLHRPEVMARLREAQPSLFVVDEAHCISEWGHDFRPEYLRLKSVVEALGRPQVLALTATAAPRVRKEIVERLGMVSPRIVVGDMDRPNIWLGVRFCRTPAAKLSELLAEVEAAAKPGIVYTATRRHAEEVKDALVEADVDAVCYHAGRARKERESAQRDFMAGRAQVVVATAAFGMGVDKPDVRFVFHFDVPGSIEAYYQELGRCGRDGAPARALLLYRPQDLNLHRFFAGGGRLKSEDLETVVATLEDAGPIDENELKERTKLSASALAKATTELEDQGLLDAAADGSLRLATKEINVCGAADTMRARQEEHRRRLLHDLDEMRMYAEVRDCRRRVLLEHFGQNAENCGYCDNCEAGLPAAGADAGERPFPVNTRVIHTKLGPGMVLGYTGTRLTVLFDDSGEKVLDLEHALTHRLLERA